MASITGISVKPWVVRLNSTFAEIQIIFLFAQYPFLQKNAVPVFIDDDFAGGRELLLKLLLVYQ